MTIQRKSGAVDFTFELTPEELEKAFREKQHEYYVEDIKWHLKGYSKTAKRFIKVNMVETVRLYVKNLEADDFWNTACEMAIERLIEKRK